MIMPICIPPYPGELLYGWIRRLAKANGYDSVEKFCERYLSIRGSVPYALSKTPIRLDYRFNMDNICKEYEEILCFPDIMKILKEMTPYFAYAPFWTRGYQARKTQMILREQRDSALNINKITMDVKELHICPQCMQEDINSFGEPYLHMEHHLQDVSVCARHRTPLLILPKNKTISKIEDQIDDYEKVRSDYSMEIQQALSRFMLELYLDPPHISLDETQLIILSKIKECGYPTSSPYGTLIDNMKKDGYWPVVNLSKGQIKRSIVKNSAVMQYVIVFAFYLFRDYKEFKKAAGKYENTPLFEYPGNYDEYDVLENHHGLMKMRCKNCGNIFHIHPYAIELGHICPECEKNMGDEENIQRMLGKLGDGKYVLTGTEKSGKTRILHETCGKERMAELHTVIYGENECLCSIRHSAGEIEAKIGNEFEVLNLFMQDGRSYITLQHNRCGDTFTVCATDFLKRPYCRKCDEEHIAEVRFRKRIQELAGDNYELASAYENTIKMVKIRHRICGTITLMKTANFLYGCRCNLCTPRGSGDKDELQDMITKYAGEEYHILNFNKSKDRVRIQGSDGMVYEGSPRFFIQELTRPTPSPVFKTRKQIMQPSISERGAVYLEAKACCEKYQVWFPELDPASTRDAVRYNAIKALVYDGYLFRQVMGVYSLEESVPDEVIIQQKYINRAGKRMGVYYGKSLAYNCGILKDKPKKDYIICNVGKKDFDDKVIRGTVVRVKKTYVQITEENYRAIEGLNLLMFLVKYTTYQKKVEDYLIREKIFLEDMEPFIDKYPKSVLKVFSKLFR